MYEAVHAHPDGESTVARFARTARRYGFDGVVVRTGGAEGHAAAAERYGVDVVEGAEATPESPNDAGGVIRSLRPACAVLIVAGDGAVNRFAAEQPRVDVIARPMAEGDVNHVVVREARERGVHVEFDFGPVLREAGGERVRALRDLRKLRELVDAHDAPYVVSANPRSHLQVRAPRELVAVGEQVGFDAEAVRRGLAAWGELAERTRRRRSGEFISPGVERGRYEEDD